MPPSQFLSCWSSQYRGSTACKSVVEDAKNVNTERSSKKVELIWADDTLHKITYLNYIFFRLCHRVSQHALRGQLTGQYYNLRSLLDDIPVLRDKYFIIGLSQGKKKRSKN